MYEDYTDQERQVLMLCKAYTAARKLHGHVGYVEPKKDSPQWKQLAAVLKWLEAKGWVVTWKQEHWSGYVRFVFENFGGQVPQPAQLKNEALFKQYILRIPEDGTKRRIDIKDIYRKVLDPKLPLSCLGL